MSTTYSTRHELAAQDPLTQPPSSADDYVEYDGDVMFSKKGALGLLNTPLNAPEPSLESVTHRPLLGSTDSADLGWIIPVALVVIVAMVGLALGCYFGIRALEMRMLGWCYRKCGCCCEQGASGTRLLSGERYGNLKEEDETRHRKDDVRLKDFRQVSPNYSGSSPVSKSIVDFNPFDED